MPATSEDAPPLSIPYKYVDGRPILADVYLPRSSSVTEHPQEHPAVVYFHAGGLTVGNRHSWFPVWFQDRLSAAGVLFVTADYRLMPPSTGLDLVDDIRDLFHYLSRDLNPKLAQYCASLNRPAIHLDSSRVAVAGSSAGGLCAYLSVMHASPKPVAVFGMYALGGNYLTPHFLSVKTERFFRGREMLDPSNFTNFLYPQCANLPTTSESPIADVPPAPGQPVDHRRLLARLYLQLGVFLDYYTGLHEPSLSVALRAVQDDSTKLKTTLTQLLSPSYLGLFPELHATSSWPPTFLVHGEKDTALPASDSLHMRNVLQAAGVDVSLEIVPGQEHSFDYATDAEDLFGPLFEQITLFVKTHLFKDRPS